MEKNEEPNKSKSFPTTRWTIVFDAGKDEGKQAEEALNQLCLIYWQPLHAFVMRNGRSQDDANDIVQSFLAKFVQNRGFAKAEKPKGKLRSFLLRSLKNFMVNYHQWEKAEKRGGKVDSVSFDEIAEFAPLADDSDFSDGDDSLDYDKDWAKTVMDHSLSRMRINYEKRGKGKIFDELIPLAEGTELSTDERQDLCAKLGKTANALNVEVCRFRERLGKTLREVVADTVDDDASIDEELRYLVKVIAT